MSGNPNFRRTKIDERLSRARYTNNINRKKSVSRANDVVTKTPNLTKEPTPEVIVIETTELNSVPIEMMQDTDDQEIQIIYVSDSDDEGLSTDAPQAMVPDVRLPPPSSISPDPTPEPVPPRIESPCMNGSVEVYPTGISHVEEDQVSISIPPPRKQKKSRAFTFRFNKKRFRIKFRRRKKSK